MDNPFTDKVVKRPVGQRGSQASSVTLNSSDSRTSESIFASEALNTELASRPSYFNPVRPGGPRLRSRIQGTAPPSLPGIHAVVKKEDDEDFTISHFALRGNIHSNTSDDTPMHDGFQISTQWHSPRVAVRDEEPTAQQAGFGSGHNASQAESSNYSAIHSASKPRLRAKPPVNIANIAATQRAMLERKFQGAKQAKSTQLQVDGGQSVQSTKEDYSWMNETPQVDDEYNQLIRRINTLQQRQDNGKITNAEGITLTKLKRELILKAKLERAASNAEKDDDEEESLFVPEETREEAAERHIRSAPKTFRAPRTKTNAEGEEKEMTENVDFEGWCRKVIGEGEVTQVSQMKKPRRKVAKNAREVHEREQQDRKTKERQKAQKKKARKVTKASTNSGTNKGKAQRKGKGGIKADKELERHFQSNREDGVDALAQRILEDLTCSDQIADRINDPFFKTAPEEAISEKRNKDTQLQKLLRNIPHGSNRKAATSDKAKLLNASRSFGFARVKAEDGKWRVKGMKSTLYHHQLLGAQWMLSRELGVAPFGGLLADAMGLGKTVQMLACMVGNLPQEDDLKRKKKATLIVAPSSVVNQWMDEIRVHAESSVFPKVYRYTSQSMVPPEILEDMDIVVTSYTQVMRQLPAPEDKSQSKTSKREYANWLKTNPNQMGDLYKVSWYRVVLDEAHAIKNNLARTNVACQNLKSLYRWCLTGTPLLNRLEE